MWRRSGRRRIIGRPPVRLRTEVAFGQAGRPTRLGRGGFPDRTGNCSPKREARFLSSRRRMAGLELMAHVLRICQWRTQMYCTKCGVELRNDDCFCCRCGTATGVAQVDMAPRRLLLDKCNKKIAGVCAGFA